MFNQSKPSNDCFLAPKAGNTFGPISVRRDRKEVSFSYKVGGKKDEDLSQACSSIHLSFTFCGMSMRTLFVPIVDFVVFILNVLQGLKSMLDKLFYFRIAD